MSCFKDAMEKRGECFQSHIIQCWGKVRVSNHWARAPPPSVSFSLKRFGQEEYRVEEQEILKKKKTKKAKKKKPKKTPETTTTTKTTKKPPRIPHHHHHQTNKQKNPTKPKNPQRHIWDIKMVTFFMLSS